MISPASVTCGETKFLTRNGNRIVHLPQILTTAWESADGSRAQILINPTEEPITCHCQNRSLSIPPMDAILLPL